MCVSLYTWRQTQKESQRSPSPENLRLLRILEQESKAVEILREDLQKCDHGSEQVNRLHVRVGWGQGDLAKLGSLSKFLDKNTGSFTFDGKDVALTSDWAENPDGSIYRRQTMGGIYRRPSPAALLQHQQEAARLGEGHWLHAPKYPVGKFLARRGHPVGQFLRAAPHTYLIKLSLRPSPPAEAGSLAT